MSKGKRAQKWFHPGSNRGPSLRESDVITNYTMKPLKEGVGKGDSISTKKKRSSQHKRRKERKAQKSIVV